MLSHKEIHGTVNGGGLNWLRASVLGANDGIVSVSSLLVGIAASGATNGILLTSGVAAVVAGALSMAVGEYISVSTQKDTEQALLAKEKWELENLPEEELRELISLYEKKGLSPETARQVAIELTEKNAYIAHAEVELGIDPNELANPWHAACASAGAFFTGALIPLISIVLLPTAYKVIGTFIAVSVALISTGTISAYVGGSSKRKATTRVLLGGVLAMIITFGVGKIFGVSGI